MSEDKRESSVAVTQAHRYWALIHKDLDSDYGVSFPDFPGCVTAGSSIAEAERMASEALGLHVEFLLEGGSALPYPSLDGEIYEAARQVAGESGPVVIVPVTIATPARISINMQLDPHLGCSGSMVVFLSAIWETRGDAIARLAYLCHECRQFISHVVSGGDSLDSLPGPWPGVTQDEIPPAGIEALEAIMAQSKEDGAERKVVEVDRWDTRPCERCEKDTEVTFCGVCKTRVCDVCGRLNAPPGEHSPEWHYAHHDDEQVDSPLWR